MVIIAPHPDDEVLGCGGIIIKAVKRGIEVFIIYLSSGDSKQELRETEAVEVCKYFKTKKPFFLKLHKTGFKVSLRNIKKIIGVFQKIQPDVVFINHEQDGDREHQIAYHLTTEAAWRFNMNVDKAQQIKGIFLFS